MADSSDWQLPICHIRDHENDWLKYVTAVHSIFRRDFVDSQPRLNGCWVRCRKDPIYDGKEAGFWHCISEGEDEATRIPDFDRCERIGWIRAIIDNSSRPEVSVWENLRDRDSRVLVWYREEFLVVLAKRTAKKGYTYYQLITAYCTKEEHRKKKLRRERDEFFKSQSENS